MGTVHVIGSVNMDVVASATRHPHPGETVTGHDLRFLPGGKGANQAVAAARAGGQVAMVGCVGDDAFGIRLLDFLRGEAIAVEGVRVVSGPSGVALIVVDEVGENTIVVVAGANAAVASDDVEALALLPADVVVAQFEIPVGMTLAAFRTARRHGSTTVLNPAPAAECPPELLAATDVLVVNETEAAFFLGAALDSSDPAAVGSAARVLRTNPDQSVVVTLGAGGVVTLVGDEVTPVAGRRVPVVDTTGAGDCFVGNLAVMLALGDALPDAVAVANAAASLCVQRPGASVSMPTIDETRALLDT